MIVYSITLYQSIIKRIGKNIWLGTWSLYILGLQLKTINILDVIEFEIDKNELYEFYIDHCSSVNVEFRYLHNRLLYNWSVFILNKNKIINDAF